MRKIITLAASLFVVFVGLCYWTYLSYNRPDHNIKVYTYSSFVSTWGPGHKLKALFEKNCNCEVQFVESSDAGLLLQRLQLEAPSKPIDLVIGFDQLDMARAQKITQWRKMRLPKGIRPELLRVVESTPFLPFDWGPLTFVYRQSQIQNVPQKLDDFLNSDLAKHIVLEDPRMSSPGFQFLIWLVHHKGIEGTKAFLREFLPGVQKVAPSWSQAYGLFQQNQAQMVWSYFTSPIVHLGDKDAEDFQALRLDEGLPLQIELMGIPKNCGNCQLASEFAQFLLSPAAQKIIMEQNFMYPALDQVRQGTAFEESIDVSIAPIDYEKMADQKEEILEFWSQIRRGL